ncbi:MAG TPA: hypothetical protein VHP36_02440 [Chitinispirillaceae bacterium]|nr:hypothetical protein [Chitinispirillaceae bacterium]
MNKNLIIIIIVFSNTVLASNLANPATNIPEARIAIGASYHLGGYTLSNKAIPSVWNRIHSRLEYAPLNFLSLGIELGATQIDIDKYQIGPDTIPVFHGKFGFSAAASLKLSTPALLRDLLKFTAISKVSYFSSKNKYNAAYKGIEGAGIVGIQFHIPQFGYITTGPLVYLIDATSRSYTGKENFISNINNIRGWIAIDFFPRLKEITTNKPYISLEISMSPEINYSRRVPVQEFSASISIGSVTRRLYGTENDIEWEP